MKKSSYLVITLILIAAIFVFYQRKIKKPEKEAVSEKKAVEIQVTKEGIQLSKIAKQIPSGGILYINFEDLKSAYSVLASTNFFTSFVELKIFEKFKKDVDEFNKKSSFAISFENMLKIFGNDLFVSFYGQSGQSGEEPDVLVSTKLDEAASYFAKFSTFFMQSIKDNKHDSEIGSETYSDIDINFILDKNTEKKYHYILIDDISHFSTDSGLLKNIIDIVQGNKTNSLEFSNNYIEAMNRFRTGSFIKVFLDFEVLESLEGMLKDKLAKNNEKLKDSISALNNFSFLYADAVIRGGIESMGGIYLKKDDESGYAKYLSELYSAPGKTGFLNHTKKSPLFYVSSNGYSLSRYYENMMKNKKDDSLEQSFSSLTGMSFIDDIMPLFGDEVVYMGTGINLESSFIPIPDFFAGISIKDESKFAAIFDKVNGALANQKNDLNLKEGEHKGYQYRYVLTPFGLAPGHGIISGYYIIFSNPSSFKGLVDSFNSDGESVFDNEKYSKMKEIIYGDYNHSYYFDINSILQTIPELFDKYSMLLQGSMSNEERREFLRKYNEEILPFVKIMMVMKYSAANGYYDSENKRFLFKEYLAAEDLQ